MKIYMDACALTRLTDDPGSPRVRAEADAVLEILLHISEGRILWEASDALATELLQNPDEEKRNKVLELIAKAGPLHPLAVLSATRARELIAHGYGSFDALHLACAEQAHADVLLTTDDRFLRKAQRGSGNPAVTVVNPVNWLKEAQTWLQPK